MAVIDAQVACPLKEWIVDIGNVLDIAHGHAEVGQIALQDVEDDVGSGVAEMRGVVGCHPTYVEGGQVAAGLEGLRLPAHRVVEA